ncbi:HlyD family efflux transporter periplasmic adaptor subunit [Paraglaciecola aquimarina]|uniref:HlyD family efflux transporter periplasmic adaptor subunit n=1 Tax=Paraglaciecola aquimarina TaxID=1235557 RepID=A0ABU3SRR7_9ALTE|nr:HlyD family efflux transporter periplasmic adaptor subunit [Paraglaciecola aquimarina]MDU0352708.1 HlyD family efflux transporter periplasmic adaptor subunit [Paraglaciecola aquimarina]
MIAKIPNLEHMQAKVFVLDKNAISLEVGQPVDVRLEAHPAQQLTGKIKSVSGFSRTIERANPTKYFELIVALNDDNTELKPGSKVQATILAQGEENSILIPLQAIFSERGENYVYLQQGTSFVRKTVKTEKKNLHFVEVSEGLADGDVIALSIPENVS